MAILLNTSEQNDYQLLLSDETICSCIKANDSLKIFAVKNPLLKKMPKDIQNRILKKSTKLDSEAIYFQACQALENPRGNDDIIWAKEQFVSLLGYKDSEQKIQECYRIIVRE